MFVNWNGAGHTEFSSQVHPAAWSKMPGAVPVQFCCQSTFKVSSHRLLRLVSCQKQSSRCTRLTWLKAREHGFQSPKSGTCRHRKWRVGCAGTLVLLREPLPTTNLSSLKDGDVVALPIQVGGDTLLGISALASGQQQMRRPHSLDLLHQILERFQTVSEKKWELLKVAIVDFRTNTYYGRLYFGDPDTKEVVWDCDCRPSDGCWLSLKTKCPLYVHETVWNSLASPLSMAVVGDSMVDVGVEPSDPMTSIMPGDLEVIRRLKREMSVAVAEEDYETAKRLRDHPYMKKYKVIQEYRQAGRLEDAAQVMQALKKEVEENEERQSGHED